MEQAWTQRIQACVFDAYGTLFDVHSAVGKYRLQLGERADADLPALLAGETVGLRN